MLVGSLLDCFNGQDHFRSLVFNDELTFEDRLQIHYVREVLALQIPPRLLVCLIIFILLSDHKVLWDCQEMLDLKLLTSLALQLLRLCGSLRLQIR